MNPENVEQIYSCACNEGVWRIRNIDPLVVKLGARRTWVVSFKFLQLYRRKRWSLWTLQEKPLY